MMKTIKFENLIKQIISCRECENKFGYEPHPVVIGNSNSKIMHISQAPSKNVHETRKPFNDASGRKLRNEWYLIDEETFYNEENFYITVLAHCYPGKNKSGGDRTPPKECLKWLKKEMDIVNPELYIIIGAKAAKVFFPKEEYNSLIFKNNILNNKTCIVLPHPSPLNIKWFKDHPKFMQSRVLEIREIIKKTLNNKK
jgi:uracil-DNA glycosylase family 4